MLKNITLIAFLLNCFCVNAQKDTVVKYYDLSFSTCSVKDAAFISKFFKEDNQFVEIISFYPSLKLRSQKYFTDSLQITQIGDEVHYYENGQLKFKKKAKDDPSITYYENGDIESEVVEYDTYSLFNHYYENRKLLATIKSEKKGKTIFEKGYEEDGTEIPNYIYMKQAEFAGGREGWMNFLIKTLNADLPAKKKSPAGKYTVILSFIVDKDGSLSNIEAITNPGYGTKEEAIRVLKKSPKWTPAIQFNKPVKYRAKQPITFVVSNE